MPGEKTLILLIFAAVFAALVHGRLRYDFVAFAALVVAAGLGLVAPGAVFEGFGHPAVAIIALVLVVSRGLSGSGVVEIAAARLHSPDRSVPLHIAAMAGVGAALSAVINNVAALSLLMPLDMEAARKAGRAAGRTLMPLSFATILGGMVTLIGTPPNIVISGYRAEAFGAPFAMFDFAPVGLAVTVAGVAVIATVGWRLLPDRQDAAGARDAADSAAFVAELRVGDGVAEDEITVAALDPLAEEHDVNVIGLVRGGRRRPGLARREILKPGDFLVVEGAPEAIETFMAGAGMKADGDEKHEGGVTAGGLALAEAIVPDGAAIAGRTAQGVGLLNRHSVTLLGVARSGRRFRDRVRKLTIRPGDVLLLLGAPERVEAAIQQLGVLPLEGRTRAVVQRQKAGLAAGIFALAIGAAVLGLTSLSVALAGVVLAYVALGLVSGREVYEAVEWKVIVLLASLIPLAGAFEAAGLADDIAAAIARLTADWPAWSALLLLMIVTMTLSDFLNNVATALIAAPVGVGLAEATGTNPDAFLMGVAVAASSAFLTPIGHKNNTIILGPGGYRFGDYWRLGLPLEAVVIAVALPAILVFWPL